MKFCPTCQNKYDDHVSFCPKDGEVLEEDPNSFVGSVLDGQYQIEALLGKGGMGAVYRARHILLGDRVAIKLLPPEMRSNTEWLRRFQREGQAARRFRHPNAVTVYDLRTSADGIIYLVMEYVEGTTLDVELKRHGRFSPAEAVAMLKPVISVLNAAHAMGVVHRDLKPENIMIGLAGTGGEPVVKLLDLGIAKLREVAGVEKTGSTALTIAGQMLGTPYYMSPEQWGELPDDGSSEIDGRADLYSLGVVFYEIIAGKRPFSGMTILELRKQHVSEIPKPLNEVTANVPAAFSKAISRAIAKDRDGRQSTAAELEAELTIGLASDGTSPSVVSTEGPLDRSGGFATVAERPSPTIGDSGAQTLVESGALPATPPGAGSQAATIPTLVVSPEELAAREAARPVQSGQAIPKPHVEVPFPRRRSPLVLVGAIAIALLAIGAGGYALIYYMGSRPATSNTPAKNDLPAPLHEVARYWIELDTNNKSDAIRAAESLTLKSGQGFKFHFSPSETGYLYIIGPGTNQVSMAFLTNKPSKKSGLNTNEIRSGIDFAFPTDSDKELTFMKLDRKKGTDLFTIIFSPTPITSPQFFAGDSEHELSLQEQKQFDDFYEQLKSNQVVTEIVSKGTSPYVAVKIPQTREGSIVTFRVTINHD